jgi:prepilin-type processing-associated H-X9-DG protein
MYTETHDGKVFGYGSGGAYNLWLLQIADLLDDINEVRYCPSTKITDQTTLRLGSATENWIWDLDVTESQQGSYGINGFLYSSTPTFIVPQAEWESGAWENINTSTNFASIPVFVDAMWVDLWPQVDDIVPADHNLQSSAPGGNGSNRNHMLRCILNRHDGEMNVSFLDGHVEPVQLKRMWSLKWSKIFEPKTQDQHRTDDTPIYKK